jgi:hypothetical protein
MSPLGFGPGENAMSLRRQTSDLWIAALLGLVVVGGWFGPRLLAQSRELLADVRAPSAGAVEAERIPAPQFRAPQACHGELEMFPPGDRCSQPLLVIREPWTPRHCW